MDYADLLSNIEQRMAAYKARSAAAIEARRARALKKGADLNDREPTVDVNGALHAPCDNYHWEDADGETRVYMAGEFLTTSEYAGRSVSEVARNRITYVDVEAAKKVIETTGHLWNIFMGTQFGDGKQQQCHLYVVTDCKEAADWLREWLEAPRREALSKAEAAAQAAYDAAECIPEGNEILTGEILSVRVEQNCFSHSPYDTLIKMLFQDDRGFKVWGTLPRAAEDCEKGSRLSFQAQLTASKDDPKFGFFKRPSKVHIEMEVTAA
jgi:hypothetical protein